MTMHNPNLAASTVNTGTLAERAMLVSLSISQWSGRKKDKAVTAEVNASKHARKGAGNYNKALLASDAMQEISEIAGETRQEFLRRTVPWMDDGSRIISASSYMELSAYMNGQIAKFETAVRAFLDKYPEHIEAARPLLGEMFDRADYPDRADLARRFAMHMKPLPAPSADDFRVQMSAEQAENIRAEIERNVNDAQQAAIRDVYGRIAETVGRMAERMAAYKPGEPGKRAEGTFKDSLVGNVESLINILPALNISADPTLSAMTDKLRPLITHSADELRANESARQNVKAEAEKILDQVSGFLA